MKYIILVISLLGLYLCMPMFTNSMKNRPSYAKLGFVPQGKLYAAILGGFRWFEGEYYTFKSITYYGGKVRDITYNHGRNVEYYNLYRTIKTAIILNPYNEDAYYFAQGAFTWGVGAVKAVNTLLEYVFKYRPWDFQIPFFLGFNYAYFLHNYSKAATYFKIAARLHNCSLFVTLASRYYYDSGKLELGINYLKYMIKHTKNRSIKQVYEIRLKALERIKFLEDAVATYKKLYSTYPKKLKDLVEKGIINGIPKDPYGGKFYITKNGKIKTTSKLAKKVKK